LTCSGCTDIVKVDSVDAYRYGRAVHASTLYMLSLTTSALLVMKMILFISDYDSNYLEYYFRIGKRL
jgi:hypothetical protein